MLSFDKFISEAKATKCGRCGTTHVPPEQGGRCPALSDAENEKRQPKNEAVNSAAKKPETYVDPNDGKTKVRMVPSKRDVVKKDAEVKEENSYTGTAPKPIRWVVSPVSSKVSNPKKYVNTEVKAKTKLAAMKLGAKEMGMKLLDVKAVPKYPGDAKLVEEAELEEALTAQQRRDIEDHQARMRAKQDAKTAAANKNVKHVKGKYGKSYTADMDEGVEEMTTGAQIKTAVGRALYRKNYKAAAAHMKKSGQSAADVARMYKGVDARALHKLANEEVTIDEVLGKGADAGDYIRDFEKSDAPQFKGKSKDKRRKMAVAAYLQSRDKK